MKKSSVLSVEIIFKKPLHVIGNVRDGGVSPGGAIFPFGILDEYNLETNSVILHRDYCVFQNLQNGSLFFKSAAPHRPQMVVSKDMVVKIREIDTGRVIYPV